MILSEFLPFILYGLIAGLLIGCVGIGGVILIPLLTYLGGIDIRTAIAAAMFAYLISGTVGTIIYARHKSIRWDLVIWMSVGAMPAALAGAFTVNISPGVFLEACIGILAIASGIQTLITKVANNETIDVALGKKKLVSIGATTGFLSALTGTGGPLVLIPILMWIQLPVLMAIGLAQAIQLPIAILATAGNAYAGTLDIVLGCALGVGISLGAWGGSNFAHRLPRPTLRLIVAILLIIVGTIIISKLIYNMLA
ncbi:MAG: sulfite exporter TauE/SafE family protein [Hyphomicrobiales bacterium]